MNEPATDRIAFSNSVRLSVGQWLGIAVVTTAFVLVAPSAWTRFEAFTPEPDYRVPHELSEDYWLFERYAGLAVEEYEVVIIGDSVVWGEYVLPNETLSHYLNETTNKPKHFANLGVGAAHPLALAGLIEHYTGSVANKTVVLQCNPVWLRSLKADLQDETFTSFNHPRLVPQFVPPIPAYKCPWFPDDPDEKQKISQRLGILVEQRVPFSKWTRHLQQVCYEQSDIPGWTLSHPYENPAVPLARGLPAMDTTRKYVQRPWHKNNKPQDFDWVDLETSLQWAAFQRAVKVLERRGNRVFVVVGPLNEHMMTPDSRQRYQDVKQTIAAWLKENNVPHVVPAVLPTDLYGDASHPLAAGYEMLARQLAEVRAFPR